MKGIIFAQGTQRKEKLLKLIQKNRNIYLFGCGSNGKTYIIKELENAFQQHNYKICYETSVSNESICINGKYFNGSFNEMITKIRQKYDNPLIICTNQSPTSAVLNSNFHCIQFLDVYKN